MSDADTDALFTLVCLGVGGGPLENDCSCYLLKPACSPWTPTPGAGAGAGAGRVAAVARTLVLEGGSFLGALTHLLSEGEGGEGGAFGDAAFPAGLDSPVLRAGHIAAGACGFLITHAHLDHILGLVLASAALPRRLPVFALPPTLANIADVFNGRIWPRLASFDPDSPAAYTLTPLPPHPTPVSPDFHVTPFPLSHPPESTAFFITHHAADTDILFLGDVEPDSIARIPRNLPVWSHAASRLRNHKLRALFLECSFPQNHPDANLYGHLSVDHVFDELNTLATLTRHPHPHPQTPDKAPVPNNKAALQGLRVIIIHVKPALYGTHGDLPALILHQLQQTEKLHQLGVHFIMAKQGMRIQI